MRRIVSGSTSSSFLHGMMIASLFRELDFKVAFSKVVAIAAEQVGDCAPSNRLIFDAASILATRPLATELSLTMTLGS
jgi:hypothetical protein